MTDRPPGLRDPREQIRRAYLVGKLTAHFDRPALQGRESPRPGEPHPEQKTPGEEWHH